MPLTAHDVAFTYNYVIKNQLSNYTMYVNFIKSVVAPNDNTVVFTCTKPKANMLDMWVYIVPQHIWGSVSGKSAAGELPEQRRPSWAAAPSSSPSTRKTATPIMTANKSYWGGAPKIDEVDFIYYQNADTMVPGDEGRARCRAPGVCSSAAVPPAQERPHLQAARLIDPELDELGFNCYTGPSLGNPVLKDWHFRQALQWAIDHNKLVQIAYGGLAQPATSVLVSHLWTQPRLALGAAGRARPTRSTWPRPARCSPPRATR